MSPGSTDAWPMLKIPPEETMESRAALLGAKRVTFFWEPRKAVVLETWPRRLKREEREGWSWIAVARSGAWARVRAAKVAEKRRLLVRMIEDGSVCDYCAVGSLGWMEDESCGTNGCLKSRLLLLMLRTMLLMLLLLLELMLMILPSTIRGWLHYILSYLSSLRP